MKKILFSKFAKYFAICTVFLAMTALVYSCETYDPDDDPNTPHYVSLSIESNSLLTV